MTHYYSANITYYCRSSFREECFCIQFFAACSLEPVSLKTQTLYNNLNSASGVLSRQVDRITQLGYSGIATKALCMSYSQPPLVDSRGRVTSAQKINIPTLPGSAHLSQHGQAFNPVYGTPVSPCVLYFLPLLVPSSLLFVILFRLSLFTSLVECYSTTALCVHFG